MFFLDITIFIALLFAFSAITGVIVQAIKQLITDKQNMSYNILAVVIALIVGICGTAIYYQFNSISYTTNSIIMMILLGLGSALCSMVGYDKIVQTIQQIKSNFETSVK